MPSLTNAIGFIFTGSPLTEPTKECYEMVPLQVSISDRRKKMQILHIQKLTRSPNEIQTCPTDWPQNEIRTVAGRL